MTCHAYLFEARSIQQYILASGRLAEMVGASKIIDALTDATLDAVLEALGLKETDDLSRLDGTHIAFSRREGGVFVALSADRPRVERLRALWTLAVQNVAPGLEWIDALASGATFGEAVDAGYAVLAQRRSQPSAVLPEATPYMRVAPRTGEPAIGRGKQGEWRDGPAGLKHAASKADSRLRKKFLPPELWDKGYIFPRELTPEPDSDRYGFHFLVESKRNVAIIHADGNGLGLILNALKQTLAGRDDVGRRYLAIYRGFSDAIGDATRNAARRATGQVVVPKARSHDARQTLPARPLVLAGDDLNIIVRADLALDFTRVFLEAFEEETAAALARWKQQALAGLDVPGLPDRLTACAGVVFCGASQPFASAYGLAEALCKAAKQQAGHHKVGALKPGGFLFHRISTSFIDDWDTILADTLTVSDGEGGDRRLTLGVYGVGEIAAQTSLPHWRDLETLQGHFASEHLSRGAMRELAMLMHQSSHLMRERYARWRANVGKSAGKLLAEIDETLRTLGVSDPGNSLFAEGLQGPATPIGDVVTLLAMSRAGAAPEDRP